MDERHIPQHLPPPCCECWPCGAGPSGTTSSDEQLKGKIEQIRELFPEYGAGFLAACLSSCGHDAERVIHQLLEGSLPPELSRLDPKMPLQPVEGKGKGKAKADDNGGLLLLIPGCHNMLANTVTMIDVPISTLGEC